MTEKPRATPRVREHIDRLREAGFETTKFFDALVKIRDDSALPKAHREAIYKLIAMESFVWYLEAINNEPIDRKKLLEEARKLAEEHSAAIVKRTPGDTAAALAAADIGKGTTGSGPASAAKPSAAPPSPRPAAVPAAKPAAATPPTPPSPTAAKTPQGAQKPAAPAPKPSAPSGAVRPAAPPPPKKK